MTVLERIRNGEDGILVVGNHPGIVQSILDFDAKKAPKKVKSPLSARKTKTI
jgi:hypothetical protein